MSQIDLRPLSLGEILDRTFSLYRRHFLLFLGIAAIPHLLTLALNLVQVFVRQGGKGSTATQPSNGLMAFGLFGIFVWLFVYIVAYLFAQGGTIYAVSDLYLGHPTTINASLRKMWGQLLNLLGVSLLNGMAIVIGIIFLIIPGIYLACRLITCVPAALLEDLGARESLERSFALTKDSAWRAFVIYFLYVSMVYATLILFAIPFGFVAVMAGKDPHMLRLAAGIMQVGQFCAGVLVTPFFLIATSVFYYDLRVRKEAFDLQLMMQTSGTPRTSGTSQVPSMLS
jgi:hypothetical protein